jgi:hypothetical protein
MYFPQRFGFHPFGDPFESKRHHHQEKERNTPVKPNGPGIPAGTYLESCKGCSLLTSAAMEQEANKAKNKPRSEADYYAKVK